MHADKKYISPDRIDTDSSNTPYAARIPAGESGTAETPNLKEFALAPCCCGQAEGRANLQAHDLVLGSVGARLSRGLREEGQQMNPIQRRKQAARLLMPPVPAAALGDRHDG